MSAQLSFELEPLPALAVGRELAQIGACRAADGADDDTGGAFRKSALRFFITHAMGVHPRAVSVPEARLASQGIVPEVREKRAWGAIATEARRLGYVDFAGYVASPDPKSHACPRGAWRWTGKTFVG